MKAWTEGTGDHLQYVIDNYSWKQVGNGTVVDVCNVSAIFDVSIPLGGSHGFACIRLAKAFPGLNFTVQARPSASG